MLKAVCELTKIKYWYKTHVSHNHDKTVTTVQYTLILLININNY